MLVTAASQRQLAKLAKGNFGHFWSSEYWEQHAGGCV